MASELENSLNNERLSLLRAKLIRRNIRVTNEWLEGCLDHFLSEMPDISNEDLLEGAFEQFTLADVNDCGLPVIPDSIVRRKDIHTIDATFVVQMNFLVNVAESAFDLLQQLYKHEIDETDEEQQNRRNNKQSSKKQRMLKLELTDGTTTCYGMEYKPIPHLNVNLLPGTKIRIRGPLKCINHVLYLESKNVDVLGGEVDTLLIENAFENILRKTLNKPINEAPKAEYAETTRNIQESQISALNERNLASNATRTQSTVPVNDDPFDDDDVVFCELDLNAILAQSNVPKPPSPHPVTTNHRSIHEFEDDPDDLEALEQIEAEILANRSHLEPNVSRKRPSTSPIAGVSSSFMYCERSSEDKEVVHVSKVPKLEGFDDLDLDDEFDMMVAAAFELPPSQPVPKPVEYHTTDYKFRLEGCNLLTFSQLQQIKLLDLQDKTFMFFGMATNVTKPLSMVEERWNLEVNLEDEPDNTLTVTLTPDLLDKMIGMTAAEIKLMRQRAKTQPSVKDEIFKILKNFNDQLKNERKFWKIKFEDSPKVLSVTNLKPVYKKVLMNKIESEKLDKLKATVPEN